MDFRNFSGSKSEQTAGHFLGLGSIILPKARQTQEIFAVTILNLYYRPAITVGDIEYSMYT